MSVSSLVQIGLDGPKMDVSYNILKGEPSIFILPIIDGVDGIFHSPTECSCNQKIGVLFSPLFQDILRCVGTLGARILHKSTRALNPKYMLT